MGYWVYILRCGDDSLYCGYTADLQKRLSLHQAGKASKYTRSRLPVKRVYAESFSSRRGAMRREIQIKRLSRVKKLELIRASK